MTQNIDTQFKIPGEETLRWPVANNDANSSEQSQNGSAKYSDLLELNGMPRQSNETEQRNNSNPNSYLNPSCLSTTNSSTVRMTQPQHFNHLNDMAIRGVSAQQFSTDRSATINYSRAMNQGNSTIPARSANDTKSGLNRFSTSSRYSTNRFTQPETRPINCLSESQQPSYGVQQGACNVSTGNGQSSSEFDSNNSSKARPSSAIYPMSSNGIGTTFSHGEFSREGLHPNYLQASNHSANNFVSNISNSQLHTSSCMNYQTSFNGKSGYPLASIQRFRESSSNGGIQTVPNTHSMYTTAATGFENTSSGVDKRMNYNTYIDLPPTLHHFPTSFQSSPGQYHNNTRPAAYSFPTTSNIGMRPSYIQQNSLAGVGETGLSHIMGKSFDRFVPRSINFAQANICKNDIAQSTGLVSISSVAEGGIEVQKNPGSAACCFNKKELEAETRLIGAVTHSNVNASAAVTFSGNKTLEDAYKVSSIRQDSGDEVSIVKVKPKPAIRTMSRQDKKSPERSPDPTNASQRNNSGDVCNKRVSSLKETSTVLSNVKSNGDYLTTSTKNQSLTMCNSSLGLEKTGIERDMGKRLCMNNGDNKSMKNLNAHGTPNNAGLMPKLLSRSLSSVRSANLTNGISNEKNNSDIYTEKNLSSIIVGNNAVKKIGGVVRGAGNENKLMNGFVSDTGANMQPGIQNGINITSNRTANNRVSSSTVTTNTNGSEVKFQTNNAQTINVNRAMKINSEIQSLNSHSGQDTPPILMRSNSEKKVTSFKEEKTVAGRKSVTSRQTLSRLSSLNDSNKVKRSDVRRVGDGKEREIVGTVVKAGSSIGVDVDEEKEEAGATETNFEDEAEFSSLSENDDVDDDDDDDDDDEHQSDSNAGASTAKSSRVTSPGLPPKIPKSKVIRKSSAPSMRATAPPKRTEKARVRSARSALSEPSRDGSAVSSKSIGAKVKKKKEEMQSPPRRPAVEDRRVSVSSSSLGEAGEPALWDSLFSYVPPTVYFVEPGRKVQKLPWPLRKMLKWRMSPITPNVVKLCIARSGFRVTDKITNWLGTWGRHMKPGAYKFIREYQKINHFPGTFQIGRKDRLWRNLSRMASHFTKKEFNFFPTTYVLPADLQSLKKVWDEGGSKQQWIIKPPASARGIGVRVISKWADVPKKRPIIVQRYISRPLLVNGNKFDLRIYVYVTSYDPLRIYIHEKGLARFASVKYSHSCKSLNNKFMHLTNYSINKENSGYMPNGEEHCPTGHKWSLQTLWEHLKGQGVNTNKIWDDIKDIVIKTIISSESIINSYLVANVRRGYCVHELFGFDIMLDEKYKAWLIEVNISPSLHSNSNLDISVKGVMVRDVLNMAGYMIPHSDDVTASAKLQPIDYNAEPTCAELMDRRLWTTQKGADEKAKHIYYCHRAMDVKAQSTILEVLTPDDVRVLVETLDENNRRGLFERVFPAGPHQSHQYLKYFDQPRYYNLLLDAWFNKYTTNSNQGISVLENYCARKFHLQNPAEPSVFRKLWRSPDIAAADQSFKQSYTPTPQKNHFAFNQQATGNGPAD